MSESINALNGQGMSLQFNEFVKMAEGAKKQSSVVRFLGDAGSASVHEVSVTSSDRVGKIGRAADVKTANDTTRAIFRQSVAAMFGGESKIPQSVQDAMKLGDYGRGKPLTARRIMAVKSAVVEALQNFPLERPAVNAPKVPKFADQGTFLSGAQKDANGVVSAQDVIKMGYAPGELKKLSDVVDMYQKATNCSLADAQNAALDPRSDARRLFSYGGVFTASPENFAKGLELLKDFSEWYDGYINGEENEKASLHMGGDYKLSVEKFVLEEISCNPKLSIDTPNKADLFSAKNNLAMQFIADNMMESIDGTMAGISPEKRSVVYALANALRENPPGGGAFRLGNALVSRTLANFPKAAELVYSGKLNRTTAFNTLFSDFTSIGLNARFTNRQIKDRIIDFEEFDGELADLQNEEMNAMDSGDQDAIKKSREKASLATKKSRNLTNMINDTGATIQNCRKAAMENRIIPLAEGVSNISVGFIHASGLTNGGRGGFLGDVNRAEVPTYNGKPVIDMGNAAFRFVIDGQTFTSKTCGPTDDPQNVAIADKIANVCNAKVHPAQANSVFVALSQGALSPQMSLAGHGYIATEHSVLNFSLTKDAETGDIHIKYENPEGSPFKFSWTSTIDVNGKVTTTPIQIEE